MPRSLLMKKRDAVYNKSNGQCWYCGKHLVKDYPDSWTSSELATILSVDHVIPRGTPGGTNHIDNLVPACRSCNSRKNKKSIEEFREHITRVLYGLPRFSQEQIDYLQSLRVQLPENFPCYPHVSFWFETNTQAKEGA
jgi:5-methylcytosine-specific restriction endonuclease McrA